MINVANSKQYMKIKYIVFRRKNQYGWVSYLELKQHSDVLLDRDIECRFLRFINRIHSAVRINKYFTLPFQSIWFKYYLDESMLSTSDTFLFVFEEGSRPYLIKPYLEYIKKKYCNSYLVYVALNSAFTYPIKRIAFFEKYYDVITSFDMKDCKDRGWLYYGTTYSRIDSLINKGKECDCDVFFVGVNKGRIQLLHDIYYKLIEAGLKCDFYITEVEDSDIIKNNGIHYNIRLDYMDVVKKCLRSRCLLEVIQEGQEGETYRQCEAVVYGIKLLTNFRGIKKKSFYNPQQMSVFTNPDDIDINFVIEEYSHCSFPYDGCLSPYKRLCWLESKMK